MHILNCKTNHLVNPIGFDMTNLVLTWVSESKISQIQKNARILVASDATMTEIIYDSGICSTLDSRGVSLDISLKPYTRYYWTVTVIGDQGDTATSKVQYFETGKMTEEWQGEWITTAWEDQSKSPYIRKSFKTKARVSKARMYIIGLGLYELEINGHRVGSELFTPYCNAYDGWLQYQTYDVTEDLLDGFNVMGVMLGNGWAKGPFGTFGDMNTPYIHDFALLCECHITYEDGQVEVIKSDTTWLCHTTPVLEDSIYDGEVYDANLELQDWSMTKCDTSQWEPAREYTPIGLGPVVERMSPKVLIKETISPIEVITTPAGETVLDMGQNMVGWIKVKINEPKGTKIKISFGEILQEGNFYRDNLRKAKAEYIYISNGTEQIIEPHFTFYGFRFAKLEGFTEEISIDNFTGCVIYSDIETIGHIETSDPLVNRLFLNALWGQKGNFLDVPTDCPQRDERMGWTGDAQIFAGTALYNMDAYAFYSKFMRDLYEEQKFSNGMVASTVPTFTQNKELESGFIGGGACAWSDAATVIPWEVYLHTGDATILKQQYQSMKDWVDWIIRKDQKSGNRKLWMEGFQFGDWLALDGPVEGGVMGGTDNGLLASAYYRLSTNILAKTAEVLGKSEEAKYYGDLSNDIKKAIQDEFFSKTGRSTVKTQTAHVVALHFDLVEDHVKSRVVNDLKVMLKKSQMHLKTGFIGTPYLCRVLSDHDSSHEAYQIFFQEDYPSWLYEVVMGATTIWERWNSVLPDGSISGTGMNSLNHYAYGSIIEWVYRNVCGIKPVETAPGFKHFIISPEIYGKLSHAKARIQSSMGTIVSGWETIGNQKVKLEIEVPFNTTATVIIKDTSIDTLEGLERNLSIVQKGKDLVIEVTSGQYHLIYTKGTPYEITYGLETPLYEIKGIVETSSLLYQYAPHLLNLSKEGLGFDLPYSLKEVIELDDGFMKGMILRGMDVETYEEALIKIPYKIRTQ